MNLRFKDNNIRFGIVFLLSFLIFNLANELPAEADLPAPLTLKAALDLAVKDNPGLAEIKARSEAMAAIPPQTRSLPDPVLSFNALNMPTDSFDLSQEPMTQMQFGITQAFPFPGKLGLRSEVSEFAAKGAAESVIEARLRLLQQVKSTWWQLYYLDRALEIVQENLGLFRQFVDIANTKYTVGEGLQQDTLLAQVELSKLLDQQINLTGMRQNISASLNTLINRAANLNIALPDTVDLNIKDITTEENLYTQALELNPLISQIRFKVKEAESKLALAHKDYYPDFKAGAFYGVRRGDNPASIGGQRSDFLTLKVSVTLPVFTGNKQDQAVIQRGHEASQSRHKLQNSINNVQRRISQATADYQRAREQFELFKDGIIPQARQTVASMLSGYKVNKVDFLNLIRSQITLLKYENSYWKSLTEANQALARLTAAVGGEVKYE